MTVQPVYNYLGGPSPHRLDVKLSPLDATPLADAFGASGMGRGIFPHGAPRLSHA